jgi:glycosyltransferase involved in cell wall biosynthesis
MNKFKITYVFLGNRIEKLNDQKSIAKEFFYSYLDFKQTHEDTQIIEFTNTTITTKITYYLNKLDIILRKVTQLPFFSARISIKKNLDTIYKTQNLIMVGDRVAVSLIFPLLYIKYFKKNIVSSVFVMGLFSNKPINKIKKPFHNLFLNLLLRSLSKLIFLGEGEFNFASKEYPKYSHKFYFLPFSIDTDFWQPRNNFDKNERDYILFIGNDGNRDYEKVLKIAQKLPQFRFKVITQRIGENIKLPTNVELINGSWSHRQVTDKSLKKVYEQAKLTIIPLKESLQPSGQSVTLQSMAMNTPVIISDTVGFWDDKKFISNKHLIRLKENSVESWTTEIFKLYNNSEKLENLSLDGHKLINEDYNLRVFHKKLIEILELDKKN